MPNSPKPIRFLALLIYVFLISDSYLHYESYSKNWLDFADAIASFSVTNTTSSSISNKASLFNQIDELLTRLPPGTKLEASKFDQTLGRKAGENLQKANVNLIEVKANLFVLTQLSPTTIPGNVDLKLEQEVNFTYHRTPNSTVINITQIQGVEVRGNWLLGWMPVEELEVFRDSAGNTLLKVTVDTLFGKTDHTLVLERA